MLAMMPNTPEKQVSLMNIFPGSHPTFPNVLGVAEHIFVECVESSNHTGSDDKDDKQAQSDTKPNLSILAKQECCESQFLTCLRNLLCMAISPSPARLCFKNASRIETMILVSMHSRKQMKKTVRVSETSCRDHPWTCD